MPNHIVRYFRDEAGEHRFQVKGANGEIIVTSEGYTRPEDARRGFATLSELLQAPDTLVEHGDGA